MAQARPPLLRTVAGMLPPLSGRARLGATSARYMTRSRKGSTRLNALTTIRAIAPLGETDARNFLILPFQRRHVFTPVACSPTASVRG